MDTTNKTAALADLASKINDGFKDVVSKRVEIVGYCLRRGLGRRATLNGKCGARVCGALSLHSACGLGWRWARRNALIWTPQMGRAAQATLNWSQHRLKNARSNANATTGWKPGGGPRI